MKKSRLILWMIFCLCLCILIAQGIREPVVAGFFYDASPEALSQRIEGYLQSLGESPQIRGEILGLIVPHAGYVYSGRVAASAYRLIRGKDYEAVIIIGPSHHYPFRGCSIYPRGGYKTPLGVAQIDEALAAKLSQASGYGFIAEAHRQEHSIEVQVPFIQKTLPQAKIVPVVTGLPTQKTMITLASSLSKAIGSRKVLIVASTDLSHFFPKEKANQIDAQTISLIQSFKSHTIIRKLERRENIMCGGGPVVSLLLYAKDKKKAKVNIIRYADSSEAGSGEDRVVGYLAAAVLEESLPPEFALNLEEKQELLQLARSSIETFLLKEKILHYQPKNPKFLERKGAFVTLKKKGRLRGCIGFIRPYLPLYQTVIQAAIYAACKDQRFSPLSQPELRNIEIEISILSPLEKVDNPRLVEVGKHGLLICKGERDGLLLPQVPVENHWSRETFLQQACLKANLPPNAWKKGADIFIFEALVFH
jgi:hypothetical protein